MTVTSAGGETNRFAAGTPVTFERISGHRDGNTRAAPATSSTRSCPTCALRAARYAGPIAGLTARASATQAARRRHHHAQRRPALPRRQLGGRPARRAPLHAPRRATTATLLATALCAPDGAWSITLGAAADRLAPRPLPRRRDARAARVERAQGHGRAGARRSGCRPATCGAAAGSPSAAWSRPAPAAASLLLERKVRGRYKRVRRRRLPVRNSRFLRVLRPSRPGLYRVTVSVDGASVRQYLRVT